jgi:hypothetical protein
MSHHDLTSHRVVLIAWFLFSSSTYGALMTGALMAGAPMAGTLKGAGHH